MVELVDTQDSKFCVRNGRAGSSPARGTRDSMSNLVFSSQFSVHKKVSILRFQFEVN